jgi:hypothetical protein
MDSGIQPRHYHRLGPEVLSRDLEDEPQLVLWKNTGQFFRGFGCRDGGHGIDRDDPLPFRQAEKTFHGSNVAVDGDPAQRPGFFPRLIFPDIAVFQPADEMVKIFRSEGVNIPDVPQEVVKDADATLDMADTFGVKALGLGAEGITRPPFQHRKC